MPSWLFHNNGDGTFTDVSKSTGIAEHLGKAWGVVATDVNNDGKMDLFVSNDTLPNFLFMNRGSNFEETGLAAEVAYSGDGRARSGMGVDSADFNEDGQMDLFVANIDEEFFSLYQNNGDGTFDDVATPAGIGMSTRWMSGWGLKFFDYDNDGNLDLIAASGFPDDLFDEASSSIQWRQPLLLFHHEGKTFRNVSQESGPVFAKSFPPVVWQSATSLTMAASTCSSATTTRLHCCCAITWASSTTGLACICWTQVESRRDWRPR
jgi:enediyne biosynthesis protein E4